MRIGFLGPEGTFTHFAAQRASKCGLLPVADHVIFHSLEAQFDALKNHTVDAIFTPIENSIEGPVNRVLDALIALDNATVDTIIAMNIRQSILSYNKHIQKNEISNVVSMPHAIAQCYTFIKRYCPNATIHHAPSTAGSVPLIEALNLPKTTTVVIGHAGISEYFPIHVIEKNIHDQNQNSTEFSLIKKTDSIFIQDTSNAKCMVAFSTHKDAPGSLLDALKIFKNKQINLSKILSRPSKNALGSYIFFVEFSVNSIDLSLLFNVIKENCLYFKPLGVYKSEVLND
jgi:prephenate dehydratase